MVTRKRPIVTS